MPAGRRARRCSAHTSALPASLKRRAILGQLAARSPRHHEASDGNGAFARTVSAIPGPSTRMAAATSATSRVSTNATLSSPACPPQVGGSPWWESVRTISASTCASPASLFPPDTWPSWPVPPATAGRSSLACRVLPRCRRADSPAASCLPRPGRRPHIAHRFSATTTFSLQRPASAAPGVRRPSVPAESLTLGVTHLQFEALLTATNESANPRDFAVLAQPLPRRRVRPITPESRVHLTGPVHIHRPLMPPLVGQTRR